MLLGVVGGDAYKWWLALHILLAVVWVGSDVAIQIFAIRAKQPATKRAPIASGAASWLPRVIIKPPSESWR